MQRRRVKRAGQAALSVSRPPPVLGWNPRDPLESMAPGEAIQLDNWFPDTGFLKVRPGYDDHATGVGSGLVETLAEFRGPASRKLIAGGGGALYDATAAGAATSLKTGFSENAHQSVNFAGHLVGCNGADTPWNYNGTAVADATWSGSGLTQANLINVTNYKSRLYFVEKNTANFWYGAVGNVTGGTLTKFDLGQIAEFGGKLMAQGGWSTVKGDALQVVLVSVMDSGEVIIYTGDDPGAASFSIVGRYKLARPIGRRCLVQIGGDLVVLTESGLIPVALIIQTGEADAVEAHRVWGKIRPAVRDNAALYRANDGWESFVSPLGDFALWNVPVIEGSRWAQIVLNPLTGAWCQYTDVPALSWATLSGETYFGTTGGLVHKHTGVSDNGAAITAIARTAFDYFDLRGNQKRVTAARPNITADGVLTGSIGVDVDFSARSFPVNTVTFGATGSTTPWGSAWDSPWGTEAMAQTDWYSVEGVGRAISLHLETSTSAQTVKWNAIDYLGQLGGVR